MLGGSSTPCLYHSIQQSPAQSDAAVCSTTHDQQVNALPAELHLVADMTRLMLQVQEGRCTAEAASMAYAEEFDARRWVGWRAWLHLSCSAKLAKAVAGRD